MLFFSGEKQTSLKVNFPGISTLKLVRFPRKKVPKSGLISTSSNVAKSAQFRFSFPPGYLTMRMSSLQPDQTG